MIALIGTPPCSTVLGFTWHLLSSAISVAIFLHDEVRAPFGVAAFSARLPGIPRSFLLAAGRRPSQGFASVFSYYLSCSEFPERLQSLNSDIEPGY